MTAAQMAAAADAKKEAEAQQAKEAAQDKMKMAVSARNISAVGEAMLAGADINSVDNGPMWSPLATLATTCKNDPSVVEFAKALMLKGASPDTRDRRGRTPLYHAITHECPELAEEMLKTAKDIHSHDGDGVCAVYRAAERGMEGVVKSLLAAGADEKAGASAASHTEHHSVRRLFGLAAPATAAPPSPPAYGYSAKGSRGASDL